MKCAACVSGADAVVFLCAFFTSLVTGHASVHVWTGKGQGTFWSESSNWQGGNAPQPGETAVALAFPAGSSRLTSTNDLVGLAVDQLAFSGTGYLLAGTNSLALSPSFALSIQALGQSNRIVLPLALQGTNRIEVATNASLSLAGVLGGTGGFSLSGGGLLVLAPAQSRDNTYPGPTCVREGTLQLESSFTTDPNFGNRTYSLAVPGSLIIGQTNSTAPAIVRGMAMSPNTALTILGSGQFQVVGDYRRFGSLTGDGLVDFQGQSFEVGNNDVSSVFSGQLTNRSEAGLTKVGNGSLTLTGRALSGVGLGVSGGKLIVDGDFSACSLVLSTDSNLGNTGFLGGNGSLGRTLAYGTLSPGHDGPGRLTCTFCDMSINCRLIVDLAGTRAGIDYDQLVISESFGFETADPVLEVRMPAGFIGSVGNQYAIIRNDGTNAVSGSFYGLPEGAAFTLSNGAGFRISYQGGDGNDVTLTQQVAIPILAKPVLIGHGQVLLTGTGSAGVVYVLEANTDLGNPAGWLPSGTGQSGSDGALNFIDVQPNPYPARYYRLRGP